MANRARKTKLTQASRIRAYLEKHPEARPSQVAKVLKVKPQNVHSTMHSDKVKQLSATKQPTFTIQEVVTIKKIGVEKVKQIIKLLEAL